MKKKTHQQYIEVILDFGIANPVLGFLVVRKAYKMPLPNPKRYSHM